MQLPVYTPSPEEKKDPHLYANNVRQMLMDAGGFGSSQADLTDCRAYISLLQVIFYPTKIMVTVVQTLPCNANWQKGRGGLYCGGH